MASTPDSPAFHLTPLPDSVPALRVELRGRTVIEASPALEALLKRPAHDVVGFPFVELFCATERRAIDTRLDDILLLGADAFGALSLCAGDGTTVLVDVNAHYVYKGGQRVEMAFRRLHRPAGAFVPEDHWHSPEPEPDTLEGLPVADDEPSSAAEPGAADPQLTEPAEPIDVAGQSEAPDLVDAEHEVQLLPAPTAQYALLVRVAAPLALNDAGLRDLLPSLRALAAGERRVPLSRSEELENGPSDENGLAHVDARSPADSLEHASGVPDSLEQDRGTPDAVANAEAEPSEADDEIGADAGPGALGAASGSEWTLAMGVLGAANTAALAVDTIGVVTSATAEAERLLGMPIARLRGTELGSLFHFPEPARGALDVARAGLSRQTVLAELADGDGQVVVEWVPAAERGSGIALLAPDTRANGSDSEQHDSVRLQARLVAFVAHDVRESLSAVHCGLRNVLDQLDSEAPLLPTVATAFKESERANRIVQDVLLVSRPGRLNRVQLDLAAIVGETVDRFQAKASEAGVHLEHALPADIQLLADFSNLDRAFANLIENAIHATPEGGHVTVVAERESRSTDGVRVTVRDTGKGIPAHLQPNIFEPFVTNKAQGTGLGLAITRRVILDHGGQIDLVSREGEGTAFNVWLPLAPA